MKIELKAVGPAVPEQSQILDTTKYVRKSWSIFTGYYLATSLAVGFGIAATLFLFSALDDSKRGRHKPLPVHAALIFATVVLGVVSATVFLIQLVSGPLVFTKDVVCRRCRSRLKVNRIAFFAGKYSRPPRCDCGGKIEPAFLWKPEPGSDKLSSTISA
jgi:hypothetical protein